MKICFVSFEYPPLIIGGAGVYAMHITRELAKIGHEVHVVSPAIERQDIHCVENDVFVHRIPIINKQFTRLPSFWFKLAKEYNNIRRNVGKFDVLHGNVTSDFSLSRRHVQEHRVITVHHLSRLMVKYTSPLQRLVQISSETGLLAPFLERVVISRAEKIIAVSRFTKNSLISTYGIDPSKITVVPHGTELTNYIFDENELTKFRQKIGLGYNITFLFVGRLNDPRKNLPFLLRAFGIVNKIMKGAKLVLAGAGDKSRIRRLVVSLGIDEDTIILGHLEDVTLKKCYAASDVVVSPSLLEGFGLITLEAMAYGKPVIALSEGANSELIRNGVNGILVSRHDPRELAAAMVFFTDHPDAIVKMGRINKEYALRNFSWRKSAKLTEKAYESVLNSH